MTDGDERGEQRQASGGTAPPGGRARSSRTWAVLFAVAMLLVGIAFGEKVKAGLARLWHSVASSEGQEHEEGSTLQYYTCGMHPWVILPKPGDCPICHMKLTPIDPDKFTGEIAIDPVVTQNMGVRVAPVEKGPITRTIRTVGTIAYDETRVRDINLKVGGWIEKLHVDYLGAPVRAGDPLFELYAPELFAAQEEYLVALRRSGSGRTGAGTDLLEAARTRLSYFDISAEQVAALAARGTASKTMTITSPYDGLVVEKHANEGMRVDAGTKVFRIADLSRVWVMATLFEYQLPYVSLGEEAVVTLPYIPGQSFGGKVSYIYPTLDERTREVKARLEFDNAAGLLKPGMFANVELRSTLARERTLVPREAVIDTGERQVAFVSLGEGRFEPRDVRMGVETAGGQVEIIDGLKPGEMVVTSGQFLLDSEARIREGLARMIRGELASEQEAVVAVSGASGLPRLPEKVAAELGALLDAYFTIGDRLARDDAAGLDAPAGRIAAAIDAILAVEIPNKPHFWHRHMEAATVRGKALEIAGVAELAEARQRFADLSTALGKLVSATGVPASYGREIQELHCPMYRQDQGGNIWLQPAGEVRNPFFGSSMPGCFDERRTLPVTGANVSDAAQARPGRYATDAAIAALGGRAAVAGPGGHAGHGGRSGSGAHGEHSPPGSSEDGAHAGHRAGAGAAKDAAPSYTCSMHPSVVRREAGACPICGMDLVPMKPALPSTGSWQDAIDRIVTSYLALQERLARDRNEGADVLLQSIRRDSAALATAEGKALRARAVSIAAAARAAEEASGDLVALRAAFKPLSEAVIDLVSAAPPRAAVADPLREAHCPMAKADWLQRGAAVDNPYYGSAMLTCGSITREISPLDER